MSLEGCDERTPLVPGPSRNQGRQWHLYREELGTLTKFTFPIFGAFLLEHTLLLMPLISIGHLSTTALAGITLGSMTANVTGFSLIQGFASALDTLLPSAWTSPQPELVGLWSQRMTVVMSTAIIPMLSCWFNAESLLLALRQDPEVARYAALYLRWISLALPAYMFNAISRRYLQSQGLFAAPTQIILLVAPINAFLCWLLVWGPEPVCLGFIGAPLATAFSINLIALITLLYAILFAPRKAWHKISRRSFMGLGILVKLGLAGIAETASEWWAWEFVALLASQLGQISLAAQSIVLMTAATAFQAPFALGIAASVRIGNLLGEKHARQANVASDTSIIMAAVFSCLTSTLFLVVRNSLAHVFNDDPEVVKLVASIIPLVALFQLFDGVSGVTAGILRARGKQILGAFLNVSAYYIFGIPLGAWLAFNRSMGLQGLWIGLTVSLVYCGVIGTWLCLTTDWDEEVEKVLARIEAEEAIKARLALESV
ncbi:multidrug/Oligosaccharidyl-lipid/Polysaccharide flippase [Mycena floridula]|nr:multidrug/Oligosaccharidyl-lipid/Polysaccharide flippase [Mycena floridula]